MSEQAPDWVKTLSGQQLKERAAALSAEYLAWLEVAKTATELWFDIREKFAGRHEAADEVGQIIDALRPMAAAHRLNGEDRGVAVLDTMLRQRWEPMATFIGADDITAIVPEYRLAQRWRVDRAVFHASGRLSLIEVKDGASPREIVAGIGQAVFYKAVAERTTSHSPIVPALAVLQGPDEDIARACSLAGVEYLPLGDIKHTLTVSRLVASVVSVYEKTS